DSSVPSNAVGPPPCAGRFTVCDRCGALRPRLRRARSGFNGTVFRPAGTDEINAVRPLSPALRTDSGQRLGLGFPRFDDANPPVEDRPAVVTACFRTVAF